MQFKSIVAALSLAMVASAAPSPASTGTPPPVGSCSSPQVLACCSGFKNGLGVGCIFSTLNLLNPTCTAGQSLACCQAPQVGLINIECIPISIVL